MSAPLVVWFRNDLRLHDHPALYAAAQSGAQVIPLFILNDDLLKGRHSGSNRNRFLLECLVDLRKNLQALGSNLYVRSGEPAHALQALVKETGAEAVYYSADFTPYAIRRDKAVKQALAKDGIQFHSFGGRLAVDALGELNTQSGQPHKVFTPFWKNWQNIERRPLAPKPSSLTSPPRLPVGELPSLASIIMPSELSPKVLKGGETPGRRRLKDWLNHGIEDYHLRHNELSADGTSRLSPYLHFGCISVREIEAALPEGKGAGAFHRQLAWRDFYHYILFNFPKNSTQEFQARYHGLKWSRNDRLLQAWQQGQTGYPIVDACMRQLLKEGWMHNRGCLIVGSFLTKDLWLDWRQGEQYFMRLLVDGDEANNNGNWQWIASVGVDPAPVFRRLYNPTLQGQRFDPDGSFIRRYVPELTAVPDKYLHEPWKLSLEEQQKYHCQIGKDYPAPIVDHAEARKHALEQYRQASAVTP